MTIKKLLKSALLCSIAYSSMLTAFTINDSMKSIAVIHYTFMSGPSSITGDDKGITNYSACSRALNSMAKGANTIKIGISPTLNQKPVGCTKTLSKSDFLKATVTVFKDHCTWS